MKWFEELSGKAGRYWDDAKSTGGKLLDRVWEDEKEKVLSDKEAIAREYLAHPKSTPDNRQHKVIKAAAPAKGINWQAAGVIVGALGLLATLAKLKN